MWFITDDNEESLSKGFVVENDPFNLKMTVCDTLVLIEERDASSNHTLFVKSYSSMRDAPPPASSKRPKTKMEQLSAQMATLYSGGNLRGAPSLVIRVPRLALDGPAQSNFILLEPPFDLECTPCQNGVVALGLPVRTLQLLYVIASTRKL